MPEAIHIGPLEKEVLEIIWDKGCLDVTCVKQELNLKRGRAQKLAYTTVMTILKRLLDKGILSRHKEGRSFVYDVKQPKEAFVRDLVHQTYSQIIDEYGETAKSALVAEAQQVLSS